jgi:hypothetical protein
MRIHNLYEDSSGESHFRDLQVEWESIAAGGSQSKYLQASGIAFRDVPGKYSVDWHPAPRRQYIINLHGAMRLTASDGESRVIGPGEVVLVEDVSGKGHLTQAVEGAERRSIFVSID